MHEIKLRYYDARQAEADGKPLSWTDRVIMLRSLLVHQEIQFSEKHGYVSFSSTKAEGANGCRFRNIDYSHPKRWRTLVLLLTDAEERELWSWCCEQCDLHRGWQNKKIPQEIYQGPNHVKYDTAGLMSFALKKSGKWWLDGFRVIVWSWTVVIHPHKIWMWCSEACCKGINHMNLLCGRYIKTEIDPQESYELMKQWKGVREIES